MKHLTIITTSLLLLPSSLSAAVPLRWTVETSAANPATFDQFAGATYDIEAALQSRGKPLAVEGDAHLYWQTNGMGSAWWTAQATVSGNVLRATWTPACDVGARVYNCFIGITGTTYNAAFQLRLRPSPGAVPNELPLPQKVIDFSRVTVLNPPWSGGGSGVVDTNDVKAIVDAEVGGTNAVKDAVAAIGSKRDKTDLKLEEPNNVHWVWTSDDPNCPEGWLAEANKFGAPKPFYEDEIEGWVAEGFHIQGWHYVGPDKDHGKTALTISFDFQKDDIENTFSATATRASATDTTPVLVDEIARASQLPSAEQLLTAAQRTAIADVANKLAKYDVVAPDESSTAGQAADAKDTHDELNKKADEFTEWTFGKIDDVPLDFDQTKKPIFNDDYSVWEVVSGKWAGSEQGFGDDVEIEFLFYGATPDEQFRAKYTRRRVLRTGDAATPSYVDGKVSDAISTNNPAFVSAVRDTPPDDDAPWGEYGTVGAAIAGLVALVALMAKRSAFAPEYSATSAYAVGDYVWHDGRLYQCKTAIASPGEAWTAAHWDGPQKLDDFFRESNSLLNARITYERNTTGLKDRAFNALTFGGTEYNLSTALAAVTPTAANQPRDLLIVATATAATTISFTAGTIKGDKPTIDGAGTWLITLTEYASGVWYCRQIKMEDAA